MGQIIYWTMGSLTASSWEQVIIVLPGIIAGIIVVYFYSRDLNLMLLGEESARHMGVDTDRLKKVMLFTGSFITGLSVSVSGIIGFVGLIVPHAIRMLVGSDNRAVLPFSVLGGIIFLLLCDTLSRTLTTGEIPVGAITALFGAPYFIFLLKMTKKKV
jgi:iron complex transport system permease protein